MHAAHADEHWMRRALRLAMNGRGTVEPNPMVGCVIVKDDQVIGEGFHQQFGGPHAEPNAIASCTENPHGATAYVTLEPCCHTNKKTPPCVPKLIDAKIVRVVIGCLDPNPEVNGKGIKMLRDAGIAVTAPMLEPESKQLIAPFLARVMLRRPYVTLKWAQTADGKIAGANGARMQISNAASSRVVHQLRARCDAIAVGINTVLTDNPQLTARGVEAHRPLLRIVLDRKLRLPLDSALVASAGSSPVVVYCDQYSLEKAAPLQAAGVEVKPIANLDALVADLHHRGITHLLVEGGPTIHNAFFAVGLADRVWAFHSPNRIDTPTAPPAAMLPADYTVTGELDIDGDLLREYLNTRSPAFFSATPSADFVLSTPAT